MADMKHRFLVIVCVFLLCEGNTGYLDFDELNSVHYGIDIIDTPVVIGKEPEGAILLRSKYGQQYQCSYTAWEKEEERERQEQQEAIDTGIPELLRPLDDTCIVYPKDWWTYELCYGKHVKQYHVEDNKITGKIIYLGHYESEFDWNNITEKNKKRKYHSQTYTNGTICDLTNKARQVEVRYECEDTDTDMIAEISEAQTCIYTLTVHTSRLCKHPYLKKATPAKPVPITCNPLISAEQYEKYLITEQEAEERRKEEAARREQYRLLNTQAGEHNHIKTYKLVESDSEQKQEEFEESLTDSETVAVDQSDEQVGPDVTYTDARADKHKGSGENEQPDITKGNVFSEELMKEVMKAIGVSADKAVTADPSPETTDAATHKEPSDTENLDSFIRGEFQAETGESLESQPVEPEAEHSSLKEQNMRLERGVDGAGDIAGNDAKEGAAEVELEAELTFVANGDELDDDEKIMAEFDKELNEIVNTAEKKAQMEMSKETIHSAMQAKFTDIVDEAEEEMAADGTPVRADRQQAFSDLAKTLTKLLARLQRAKKEKRRVESHLQKAQAVAAAVKIAKERREARKAASLDDKSQVSDKDTEPTDPVTEQSPSEPGTETSQTAETPDSRIPPPQSDDSDNTGENDVTDNVTADDDSRDNDDIEAESLTNPDSLNDRVRVRVTRIKHGGQGEPVRRAQDEDDGKHNTLQLPDEQQKELESTVKSELKRAGLETNGQKIEVKIITAGYFDTNKEGVHVLSQEESSAFNNMIVSILGGNSQAAREVSRHQRMEDNYSRVWGDSTSTTSKQKQSSTSTEEPPVPPS